VHISTGIYPKDKNNCKNNTKLVLVVILLEIVVDLEKSHIPPTEKDFLLLGVSSLTLSGPPSHLAYTHALPITTYIWDQVEQEYNVWPDTYMDIIHSRFPYWVGQSFEEPDHIRSH
jgi:hypothetical protein